MNQCYIKRIKVPCQDFTHKSNYSLQRIMKEITSNLGWGARDGKDSNRFFLGKGDLKKTQSWSKEGGSTRHPHSPCACGTGKCSAWYRAELVGFPLDKWGSRSLLLTKYTGREGQHTSS